MTVGAYAMRCSERSETDASAAGDAELFERLVHDLRNPLGVIAYFAEAIPGAQPAEREELSERLRLNAQRALQVLEEMSLLADLRAGRAEPAVEAGDVGQLIEALAGELEAMERAPGRVRRHIDVRRSRQVPRGHLACALRPLLRAALRATAPDTPLDLQVHDQGRQIVVSLSAPRPADGSGGDTRRILTAGVDTEISTRVAALYRGHCVLEQLADRDVVTLTLPLPVMPLATPQ